MLLNITHETRYEYSPPVETAQHMAHLRPLNLPWQRVMAHALEISPTPAQQSETSDVYGNTRAFFSLQGVHEELVVVARSTVVTTDPPQPRGSLPWEQVRERFRYHAGGDYDAAAEFVFASPYVPRHENFASYARPSFTAGTPVLMAARDLMDRIHTDFTYETDSTEVNTPALEALAQRKGVCQDFAHIMVASLRAMGLAARYVSGYLLTEPPPGQPRLVGSDASHAWVSVYVPDELGRGTWCDLDPTNNRAPGEDYVTLAIGRDYSDVSPMRGVIHGGANHTLHVGVTVEPVNETATEPAAPTSSEEVKP
ncbi:transglutaminase family protein [Variovorax sp. VNK109]|jgi:transglutaminase-like putative cysteine protease|uniref:transglutaminase family protein n=1 Tax=Variovorax sp. VNK109 TaxID=3400919 RepID=UPI003BFC01FE